jgi:hypothetical protein
MLPGGTSPEQFQAMSKNSLPSGRLVLFGGALTICQTPFAPQKRAFDLADRISIAAEGTVMNPAGNFANK